MGCMSTTINGSFCPPEDFIRCNDCTSSLGDWGNWLDNMDDPFDDDPFGIDWENTGDI